jgi:hypothetical protein
VLALESFLRRYVRPKRLRQNLGEIDEFLRGQGIMTDVFKDLYKDGKVTSGVLVGGKKMTDFSWAIIQAWEEHFYKSRRRFDGYALEFAGTPNQTVSIVFDDPISNLSVRIIYDDNFKLPYVLYKDFSAESVDGVWEIGDRPLLERINVRKDMHNRRVPFKYWREKDDRTGRVCVCYIYEPTMDIRRAASELSLNASNFGIKEEKITKRYIDRYREIRSS